MLPWPRASVAARLSVARRASAATAATQARLCSFQCFFWHGFPQYQARWHCEQHILAPSDWQWKQRWVSDAAAFFLPFLPSLPFSPVAFSTGAAALRVLSVPWASSAMAAKSPTT